MSRRISQIILTFPATFRSTVRRVADLGDKLLRELVGPVHVVAAGDDAGQLVRGHVCLHHHLCARLGGGVGVGGLQGSRLVEAHLCTHAGLTVHLRITDIPVGTFKTASIIMRNQWWNHTERWVIVLASTPGA